MIRGEDFEVSKEVYERARARHLAGGNEDHGIYYMAEEDREKHFSKAILCGYGLYNCRVREVDGKYICSYMTGSSCD